MSLNNYDHKKDAHPLFSVKVESKSEPGNYYLPTIYSSGDIQCRRENSPQDGCIAYEMGKVCRHQLEAIRILRKILEKAEEKHRKYPNEKGKIKTKNWRPNLKSTPVKKGKEGLLDIAFEGLRDMTGDKAKEIKKLKDENGRYGIETQNHILCAKKEPYGNIISVDQKAVKRAFRESKKILIYIQKNKSYYEYDPEEIMKESEINEREKSKMMNFRLNMGRNYGEKVEQLKEIERKQLKITKKEQEERDFWKNNNIS